MTQDIETAAKELLALCGSPNTSGAVIDAVLSEHEECFDATSICEICSYIEEELFEDDVLDTLAGNPSLSPQLQEKVLQNAFKWQGKQFAVLYSFAYNSNVADSVKVSTLDPDLITDGDDIEDVLVSYLEAFKDNSRYTKDEIKEFVKKCNSQFDLPDGWSK